MFNLSNLLLSLLVIFNINFMQLIVANKKLPTLYKYYSNGKISEGLKFKDREFILNKMPITIYSGSLHYFRVPRAYWRNRLRKMRAAGLNAVATYVPWNLHEPTPGNFDFGDGQSEMTNFLDLFYFLKVAQEEDLFVIVRPGPYICAEFEFGGLPSWLINKNVQHLRTSNSIFMDYVQKYFSVLISKLVNYQYTKGGSIIMFQISNEYGHTKKWGFFDELYLQQLKKLLIDNGVVELLVMSDIVQEINFHLENVIPTINFVDNPTSNLKDLESRTNHTALMVMEFWTGWFDHWGETHHIRSNWRFRRNLLKIITYPASVNLYMFHGGTTFGFLNGANIKSDLSSNNDQDYQATYEPTISSYDYNAILTERGDYTPKYRVLRGILKERNDIQTHLPQMPAPSEAYAYGDIRIVEKINFNSLLENVLNECRSYNVTNMESLPINNNSGQHYGYIVYRKMNLNFPANSELKIDGYVYDTVMVLLNGKLISPVLDTLDSLNGFGAWRVKGGSLKLPNKGYKSATLDLIVENMGRINFGNLNKFQSKKGLWEGAVYINDRTINYWGIFPLEFRKNWINSLKNWQSYTNFKYRNVEKTGPNLYKAILEITDGRPRDTFINMKKWVKGFVAVNGFNLGRYWIIGPQFTLYLPAPFLKSGINEIVIFEHFKEDQFITFSNNSMFESVDE